MKQIIIFFQIFLLACCTGVAQRPKLKSGAHGLDMMLKDIPKEQLIGEIRFEDGKDDTIGVVRFDHIGPSLLPLLVSSKLPIATDSLGILSFKLHKDTLDNFLFLIDNINPKSYDRHLDYVLIRVTYRYKGRLSQYYVTNGRIATGFCRILETSLIANNDLGALQKFYEFLGPTKLFSAVKGKRVWKFE